jgi:repressor LexA
MKTSLTRRQGEILRFIMAHQREHGTSPSQREIASFFDFRSVTAVADHLRALRRKGYLEGAANQARSLRVITPPSIFEPIVRSRIVDIPLLGEIPAGFADKRDSGSIEGCVSVDVDTLGVKPTSRTFALEVRGDSMIGRHIMHGDYAILEHGVEPRGGEVVAALIDNESTLKTFVKEKGKAYLRAENPRYPDLIPAGELVIQGVMVALIRRCR